MYRKLHRPDRIARHRRVEPGGALRPAFPSRRDCGCLRALRRGIVVSAASLLILVLPWPPAAPAQAAPGSRATVVIYKSQRRLFYFEDDILRRRFPVTLGKRPEWEKRRQGDFRTPEGAYFISSKRPRSRFLLFLGLSYPNTRDGDEGLRRGAISTEEFEAIRAATRDGREPPWGTALGGFVGIHGEGSEYRGFVRRHHIDWTDGCIALSNEDIRVLYHLVRVGTPVLIFP